ncbi:hypothetical protein C8R44DRAFT_741875 [Mycena epipterygia]|nr:hypothetical protein C8R44DRAFT_741875 [Mycena epipterygia]
MAVPHPGSMLVNVSEMCSFQRAVKCASCQKLPEALALQLECTVATELGGMGTCSFGSGIEGKLEWNLPPHSNSSSQRRAGSKIRIRLQNSSRVLSREGGELKLHTAAKVDSTQEAQRVARGPATLELESRSQSLTQKELSEKDTEDYQKYYTYWARCIKTQSGYRGWRRRRELQPYQRRRVGSIGHACSLPARGVRCQERRGGRGRGVFVQRHLDGEEGVVAALQRLTRKEVAVRAEAVVRQRTVSRSRRVHKAGVPIATPCQRVHTRERARRGPWARRVRTILRGERPRAGPSVKVGVNSAEQSEDFHQQFGGEPADRGKERGAAGVAHDERRPVGLDAGEVGVQRCELGVDALGFGVVAGPGRARRIGRRWWKGCGQAVGSGCGGGSAA